MSPIPSMEPQPDSSWVCGVGDRITITLRCDRQPGDRAALRTTIGRNALLRAAMTAAIDDGDPVPGVEWRDVPMTPCDEGFTITCTLTEPGTVAGKARLIKADGSSIWPAGGNCTWIVHPAWTRFGNTIYCAFTRQFGSTKQLATTRHPVQEDQFRALEKHGYAVLPPSGKLRDLTRQLDHIFATLGCRILHLLPINPTPTTYARFGRFGSPYAALDFTDIDPALVEFDRRTTALDQFRELVDGVHKHDGRLILDLALNHTGWGSTLINEHPDWFRRDRDDRFQSPGAWGVTWEDLVELDHQHAPLWHELADALLTWCERGVDGFRCDAGYMIPLRVWQALIAKVQEFFPDTVFLLEGLGGSWQDTADLLTVGGMHWAYSELFQNEAPEAIATYTDHCNHRSLDTGLLIHYSETHDNNRLAARGRTWALLRNQLSALTATRGGFGFTAGVEWLASEKLEVHRSRGLNWGSDDNLVAEIATLNKVLVHHPAFRDGAQIDRLTGTDEYLHAWFRTDADERTAVVIVANTDCEATADWTLPDALFKRLGDDPVDLLDQTVPWQGSRSGGHLRLAPGQVLAIADAPCPAADHLLAQLTADGPVWRALGHCLPPEDLGSIPDHPAAVCARDPRRFCTAVTALALDQTGDWDKAWADAEGAYAPVTLWTASDTRRVVPMPTGHWLVVAHRQAFRLHLQTPDRAWYCDSFPGDQVHLALVPPDHDAGDGSIHLLVQDGSDLNGSLRMLDGEPARPGDALGAETVLLTNGRGGMAHIPIDLPNPTSKYDCLLGANLHGEVPVDRHVLVKNIRAWVLVDGIGHALDRHHLIGVDRTPTAATWRYRLPVADRAWHCAITIAMLPDRNTTVVRWQALDPVVDGRGMRLSCRFDCEDRSFHSESSYNQEADAFWHQHLDIAAKGFAFTPAADRSLRIDSDVGHFHPEPEWRTHIPHPIEGTRGLTAQGDAFAPGWFDVDLEDHAATTFVLDAEAEAPAEVPTLEPVTAGDPSFSDLLKAACDDYLVRRENWQSVIAGYPWFLDWGRDTLICARGLLAAGHQQAVEQIIVVFGRFAEQGTLPNCILGEDASNRDTSDAPLWYGVVVEEYATSVDDAIYQTEVAPGRTVEDVLDIIASGYRHGTPNGIRMDKASGLVWSPSHFTWMDTNHPAGTPREGYPIEIQALWWRLVTHLGRRRPDSDWCRLGDRIRLQIATRFWSPERGWLADSLRGPAGTATDDCQVDDALRSNALTAIALGAIGGIAARQTVEAAADHLLIPGAIRSLAPLPVKLPCPVHGADGALLNDPFRPYAGRYEGDEDSRRKPAYHNGTAWVWPFPAWCEAVLVLWGDDPHARAAVRAQLAACDRLLAEGCAGHLPEILDGDAPHQQRGCDAQAWSVTEVLRIWLQLAD